MSWRKVSVTCPGSLSAVWTIFKDCHQPDEINLSVSSHSLGKKSVCPFGKSTRERAQKYKKGGKYTVEFYWEILSSAFALFFFFLPLSLSFLSFDFSSPSSPLSFRSLYQKDTGKAARCISVFHTLVNEVNDCYV